ncbi:jg18832, partial [Pararge aegeria aegeria]
MFTWRWRLPLRKRAWNEPGVSMVCWRDSTEWGALTELCLNH